MLSFLINHIGGKCYKINHKGNPCFKGKNNQDPLNYNWVKSNPFIIWVKMSIDPITNAAKKNIIANAAKTIGTFFFWTSCDGLDCYKYHFSSSDGLECYKMSVFL